jgi:GT2 family glycosyltransferase
MHRSGTSALTRVVSLLGAQLPRTLLSPSADNERGYWESAPLVARHDRLLGQLGSRWDDWRSLDLDGVPDNLREEIKWDLARIVAEEYPGAGPLVVKDPRICRLVPFFVEVLAARDIEPRFILAFRNPLAVIASLARRDGMTPGFAALMWLRHVLDAECATRDKPRAVVSYEALLADWQPVMRGVARKIGLSWPRAPQAAEQEVAAFLSTQLQHFAHSAAELGSRRDIAEWVKQAYRALMDLEADVDRHAALAALDRVRGEFGTASRVFGAATFQELAAREGRAAEIQARHVRAAEERSVALTLRERDIAGLREEISERDRRLGRLDEVARTQSEGLADLNARLSEARARVAELETRLEVRDAEVDGLKSSVAGYEGEISRLRSELSAVEQEARGRQQEAREVRSALEAHQARLAALETSKSWRLTHPLRAGYSRWLAARRRWRLMRPQLVCLNEIEQVGAGAYLSLGRDPQLRLALSSDEMPKGWIAVRWTMRSQSPKQPISILYLDYGAEIVAERARYSGSEGEIICAVGEGVRGVRFDPLEEQGRFELRNFRIARLGRSSAAVLLAHRLWAREGRFAAGLALLKSLARMYGTHGRQAVGEELVRRYRGLARSQDLTQIWRAYQERLRGEVLPQLADEVTELPRKPLISVIVATYNTPETLLSEMVASVQGQIYDAWELIVVDDASAKDHVRTFLSERARADQRIKLRFSDCNGGVSAALNQALELASGEYVALMDHDDLLEPHALMRMAQCAIADAPDMIYSDEVIISADATRVVNFAIRPSFSQEYLRGHPYIVHLVAFRRSFLATVGGFDASMRISQDYDLILRATEVAQKIVHVPEVLYQWRLVKTSLGHQLQDRVTDLSCAALERHLGRSRAAATVSPSEFFNFYDVRYPLSADSKVAIIIPTKNNGDWVRRCVGSIRSTVIGIEYAILIADHQSSDADTLAYLDSLEPPCRVERFCGEFNFSRINNWATRFFSADFTHFLFCNNDIEAIEPGWLERMVGLAQKHDVGAIGAKLLYPDRALIQHGGVGVGLCGPAEHYAKWVPSLMADQRTNPGYGGRLLVNHEVSAVTAACMLVRRDAFEAIGGFDDGFAVGFGDVDLCLRMRCKGYRVMMCPGAVLTHHESLTRGKSSGRDPHPEDTALFVRRWAKVIEDGDPYFNPQLDPASTSWAFRDPMPCHVGLRSRVWCRPPSVPD